MQIGPAVVAGTAFGLRVHVRALRAAGYDVVALVGRDPVKTARKAEKAGIARSFTDLGEALALRPKVVAISTPPHTHAELAHQALNAGAHVVCEKPFTLNLDEAVELAALAETKGLIGLLGHEFRYVESTALFGRLLDDGVIGPPQLATLIAHSDLAADLSRGLPEWWFDAQRGGGWFGASGSHAVDRIRDWFGEVAAVSAHLTCVGDRPAGSADDTFDIRFRTLGDLNGALQSTAAAWGPPTTVTRAVGPMGAMWIEDEMRRGNVESVNGAVHVADQHGVRVVPVPVDLRLPPSAGTPPELARNVDPFAQLYRDLTAMAEGRLAAAARRPRPATFADGCANMRVMRAVQRSSAADGGWTGI